MSKTLYRINQSLLYLGERIPAGAIKALSFSQKTLDILLAKGAISEVVAPLISILPEWKGRAGDLMDLEVTTVTDLLATDDELIAAKLDITHIEVQEKKVASMKWLEPPDEDSPFAMPKVTKSETPEADEDPPKKKKVRKGKG